MRIPRLLVPFLATSLLAAIAAPANGAGRAQLDAAPASAIRAAMLLNFVKFVEWPAEQGPADTRVLCIVDDPAVADALEEMARGRSVDGRAMTVKRLKADAPANGCHLLYSSGLDREKALRLVARLKDAPVFSVSDYDQFAALGGTVHFFVQRGKMRFAINPAAAQRARLKVSSQLLSVGTIVKDEHAY